MKQRFSGVQGCQKIERIRNAFQAIGTARSRERRSTITLHGMYREKQLEKLDVGRLGVDAPVKDTSAYNELQLSCIRLVCETYSRFSRVPRRPDIPHSSAFPLPWPSCS